VYLHVFDWPATGDLRVPAFEGTVKSARLLANRDAQVPVSATPDGITLRLPVTAPDPIASVVALELE
jgi:alpha-L-fucosidase